MNNTYYVSSSSDVSPAIAVIMLISIVIGYIIGCLPMYLLAKKANHNAPFLAWIPIANSIQQCQIAKISIWWFVATFIPFVGWLAAIYTTCKFFMAYGRSPFAIIILFIPIVNFIYIYYLALSKDVEYVL